jgi:[ribosomal protein S18]-alanine N-acetyltransferase
MRTATPTIRPVLPESDAAALVAIERLCFDGPWLAHDFERFLAQPKGLGFAAIRDDRLAGYALLEALPARLQLVRIAVHPRHWGRGIGRHLLRQIKSGLRAGGRNKMLCEVDERNVHAQLFLKKCDFRAIGAIEDFFPEGIGAIQFEFRLQPRDPQLDFFCFRRARQR